MVDFHIEATSKCTLECPLCDRTWFYKKFKKRLLKEIDIYDLERFIGTNKTLNICGNNGDPIYHSKFYELCKNLKKNKCNLLITTNGSYRSQSWWERLSKILDKNDVVTFSIDGLEDTNNIYRINSDWESIIEAITILRNNNVRLVWKFIIFKHNEHQIKQAKNLSAKLGFERFKLERSHRFLEDTSMMPSKNNTDEYYIHQKQVLTDENYKSKMTPKCLLKGRPKKSLYVDAEGNFYPCCWMGSYRYRYKSIFNPTNKKYNIKNITIDEILNTKEVKNFFQTTKDFKVAHECCKLHCGINNG